MTKHSRNLDVLEALADAAAQVEEEEGKPTPASRAAARRYQTLIGDKLAEMRRAELARHGSAKIERQSIPDWLRAMSRTGLEALQNAILTASPSSGFAFRNLKDRPDDDLRTAIQDALLAMEKRP